MPKLVLLRKTSLSYDIEELSKTKNKENKKNLKAIYYLIDFVRTFE